MAAWGALDILVIPDVFWMLAAEFIRKGAQFLLGGLGSQTGGEPSPHAYIGIAGASEDVAAFDEVGLLRNGEKQIGMLAAQAGERVRSDADDGDGLLVQVDDASDNGGITAITPPPEAP